MDDRQVTDTRDRERNEQDRDCDQGSKGTTDLEGEGALRDFRPLLERG